MFKEDDRMKSKFINLKKYLVQFPNKRSIIKNRQNREIKDFEVDREKEKQ